MLYFILYLIHPFSGEHYYKYNSDTDRVVDGWPRLIKEDFGPKPGETEAIPDNIDTVFFDIRDKNIYFFKNEYVSIESIWEILMYRMKTVMKIRRRNHFSKIKHLYTEVRTHLEINFADIRKIMSVFSVLFFSICWS